MGMDASVYLGPAIRVPKSVSSNISYILDIFGEDTYTTLGRENDEDYFYIIRNNKDDYLFDPFIVIDESYSEDYLLQPNPSQQLIHFNKLVSPLFEYIVNDINLLDIVTGYYLIVDFS